MPATKFTATTDKKNKFKLDTEIVEARWTVSAAWGDTDVPFEVQAKMCGDGAKIEITGRSEDGAKFGTVKSTIYQHRCIGAINLPSKKIQYGDRIYFEAKMPKHGLKAESESIPAYPAFFLKKIEWSAKEVRRGDTVTIKAQFEGVPEGHDCMVRILEYGPGNFHEVYAKIPANIKNNRLEIQWVYKYTGDTGQIQSQEDLDPYKKKYLQPRYFFTVDIDKQVFGKNQESGLLKFIDTLEVKVMDNDDQPLSDRDVKIYQADGSTKTVKSDSKGMVIDNAVIPGPVYIELIPKGAGNSQSSGLSTPYTVKPFETLTKIARKFALPGRRYIYDHGSNADLRSKCPDPVAVLPNGLAIKIPECTGHPAKSGGKYGIVEKSLKLVPDAHMHIQSNNCAAMTIQWAVLAVRSGGAIPRGSLDRRQIGNIGSSRWIELFALGRLGVIGRLSTDLVARLYMHDLHDSDMHKDAEWIVQSDWFHSALRTILSPLHTLAFLKPSVAIDPIRKIELPHNEYVGKLADLSEMNEASRKGYEQYMKKVAPYYTNCLLYRFQCTQTFDLTFAHFWGIDGIPIYMDTGNDWYYINDFVSVRKTGTMDINTGQQMDTVAVETNVSKPLVGYHLFPRPLSNQEISIKEQFSLFMEVRKGVRRRNDRTVLLLEFEGDLAECERLVQRKYIHIVEKVKPEEKDWYESYFDKQLPLSEGAAINYPLQNLLFYFYDPRCHAKSGTKETRIAELASRIVRDHAFFTMTNGEMGLTHQLDDSDLHGSCTLKPAPMLNTEAIWKEKLKLRIQANNEVFERLLRSGTSGIYWGIKMYCRFGCSADDTKNYPHLAEMYDQCVSKKIPILVHCSDGGMQIADYHNYLRYYDTPGLNTLDRSHCGEVNEDNPFVVYDLLGTEELVGEKISSPAVWRNVLKSRPSMIIDLAHFGSYDIWSETSKEYKHLSKIYEKYGLGKVKETDAGFFLLEKVITIDKNKMNEYDREYVTTHLEKLNHRYVTWVLETAKMVEEFENVYTDLACSTMRADREMIPRMADNLVYLMRHFHKLHQRILIGSDWPMIELDGTGEWSRFQGTGTYMSHMFDMLKRVSELVHYDAWHQFGVVNLLRFLGLIKEKDPAVSQKLYITEGEKEILTEELEEYGKRLNKIVISNCDDLLFKYKSHIDVSACNNQINAYISLMKNNIIKGSTKIIKNNKLSILGIME